jgi:putative membrane-bound dehydrogenase-like protein
MLSGPLLPQLCWADEPFIPRRQSQPPGPPLSPQEALAKMVVPEGFHVELVASEPDLINPVAMAFDDRGRLFVTESFEYPRREPGPGRDRIKILEDTNGDGRFDSVKIFAEGLNIPSGIAVGYGGVWVANAPDILFLQDTNGDDRADKQTVVVTGFGRDDTHELPNALTWGPDGYLYGLNGVFNRSVVEQDGRKYDFTCAMFRIDPLTHRFDLFCEGTSNPWGIAFNHEGDAFISACVIDHLWHLSETGYYHRQGGPYPPHTWKIESIVDYRHQAAAYCGLEFFDSPAYPAEYRGKLYMGNIHGGCINVDSISRKGSTYRGQSQPDFLTANDVWFMPVAQKVGPDGCLYVLDWYDRYHCYQDANADPEGVDRGHGRLYRVVYGKRPEIAHRDLSRLDDGQLIGLLEDENIFYRQRAAVLLAQRLRASQSEQGEKIVATLLDRFVHATATGPAAPGVSLGLLTTALAAPQLPAQSLMQQLSGSDPLAVSWAVRFAGNRLQSGNADEAAAVRRQLDQLASHADPRVRLQVAIAANKVATGSPGQPNQASELLLKVLRHSEDDGQLPRIVWRNLEPHVLADQETIVKQLSAGENRLLGEMAPRIATRLLAEVKPDLASRADQQTLRSVLAIADSLSAAEASSGSEVLRSVLAKLRTGEIRPAAAGPILSQWAATAADDDLTVWQLRSFAADPAAHQQLADILADAGQSIEQRKELLSTVAITHRPALDAMVQQWLTDRLAGHRVDDVWQDALLGAVVQQGSSDQQRSVLGQLAALPPGVQARVAGLMVQRESTATLLLDEIAQERLAKDMVGPNQIRQLAASRSPAISQSAREIWGTIRLEESPNRQGVVRGATEFLLKDARGDARRGLAVYDRICGQCHVMHGRGFEVGPEITRNGRGSFEQLVISVFDPSLVIGDAYKSVTVLTTDGRVISGLVTERTEQRIVLKVSGGKLEVVPMDDVEEIHDNTQSLMPEGLEEQMTREEMADLFALLSLEKLPGSEDNRVIAGTPDGLHVGQ